MPSNETEMTLSEKLRMINEKYATPSTAVKKQVAGAKSSRGPSLAGRISGLQRLQPKLGKQFSKTKTIETNE